MPMQQRMIVTLFLALACTGIAKSDLPTRQAAQHSQKRPAVRRVAQCDPPVAQAAQPTRTRTLIPMLPAKGEDIGLFFDVINEANQDQDIDKDMETVRMTLDGQEYAVAGVFHSGGHHVLHKGEKKTFDLTIGNFRMDARQKQMVTLLPLKAGRHVVSIRFGGIEYGPMTFIWQTDNRGHQAWVEQTLKHIVTIKPGDTRADLLKIFTTEGGLSSSVQRTYVYRTCPYIKVNVEFRIAGRPERDGEGRVPGEDARDVITKISKPFIDWSILD